MVQTSLPQSSLSSVWAYTELCTFALCTANIQSLIHPPTAQRIFLSLTQSPAMDAQQVFHSV
jgi:hypothetical protein